MRNKIFIMALLALLMGLFFIPTIVALGITPGRTTIDFSSNLVREVEFSVINTENKDMNIAFSIEGDLKDYIKIKEDVVNFKSNESSKSFKYNITLPNELPPGLHKADVIALELPPDINDPGMIVRATVSVVTQVYVYVPYPGKYIESTLDIVKKENTNTIDFYIPVISRGEEQINSVNAVIDIYKVEKVASVNTNTISMSKGERKELSAVWNPDVAPGKYKAIARVKYDEKEITIEKEFTVGPEDLGLIGISVNDFKLGDVAKIRILVQNKLSDEVNNTFAKLKIYNLDLDKIADLKSEDYIIPPTSNKEIIIYWDTEKVEKGLYDSELRIDYDKKFINKNFKTEVTENSISFSGVGFAVSSGAEGKISITTILLIVIGILVIVNLAWLLLWLKNKKKR